MGRKKSLETKIEDITMEVIDSIDYMDLKEVSITQQNDEESLVTFEFIVTNPMTKVWDDAITVCISYLVIDEYFYEGIALNNIVHKAVTSAATKCPRAQERACVKMDDVEFKKYMTQLKKQLKELEP